MTIKIEQAINLVKVYLTHAEEESNKMGSGIPNYRNPNTQLAILNEKTEEYEFGWVFYYNSVKYIETGDFRDALGGNAPLIVNRFNGEIIETGTAQAPKYYINNYVKTGNPHLENEI